MCIFFSSKEKAEEAYQMMKDVYYPAEQKALVTQDSDIRSDLGYALMIACIVIPVILAMNAAFK